MPIEAGRAMMSRDTRGYEEIGCRSEERIAIREAGRILAVAERDAIERRACIGHRQTCECAMCVDAHWQESILAEAIESACADGGAFDQAIVASAEPWICGIACASLREQSIVMLSDNLATLESIQ